MLTGSRASRAFAGSRPLRCCVDRLSEQSCSPPQGLGTARLCSRLSRRRLLQYAAQRPLQSLLQPAAPCRQLAAARRVRRPSATSATAHTRQTTAHGSRSHVTSIQMQSRPARKSSSAWHQVRWKSCATAPCASRVSLATARAYSTRCRMGSSAIAYARGFRHVSILVEPYTQHFWRIIILDLFILEVYYILLS